MSGWKDDDAVTITYRTLRQAQAEAAGAEQERIIKLLEAISDPAIPMGELYIPGYQMREIIALIKGEK